MTIDLAPAAAKELDRIRLLTGLSFAELFRHALTLLRIYIDARQRKLELRIVDPKEPTHQTRLEFPIDVEANTGA